MLEGYARQGEFVYIGFATRIHDHGISYVGNGKIRRHVGLFRETMPYIVAELSALKLLCLAGYSLTHYSKWVCTFDNNGCANYVL